MTEHKKERISLLSGNITETSSSDSFIENKVKAIGKEIAGLTDRVVDVELEDVLTVKTHSHSNHETGVSYENQPSLDSLKHSQSDYVSVLQRQRAEKKRLKKAA